MGFFYFRFHCNPLHRKAGTGYLAEHWLRFSLAAVRTAGEQGQARALLRHGLRTPARRSSTLTHLTTLALQPVGYLDGRSPRGSQRSSCGRARRCLARGPVLACAWRLHLELQHHLRRRHLFLLGILGDSGAIGLLSNLATPPRWQLQPRARTSPANLAHALPPPLTHARLA